MENEVKSVEKKKSNGVLIIAILVILCLAGYICYDKVLAPATNCESSTNSQVEETTNKVEEKEENTSEEATSTIKFCDGEYHGEYTGGNWNVKGTYSLNKDGTYTSYYENSEGTNGNYLIIGNTILFVHKSNYEDGYITEEPLEIAEDCSYMIRKLGSDAQIKFEKK